MEIFTCYQRYSIPDFDSHLYILSFYSKPHSVAGFLHVRPLHFVFLFVFFAVVVVFSRFLFSFYFNLYFRRTQTFRKFMVILFDAFIEFVCEFFMNLERKKKVIALKSDTQRNQLIHSFPVVASLTRKKKLRGNCLHWDILAFGYSNFFTCCHCFYLPLIKSRCC